MAKQRTKAAATAKATTKSRSAAKGTRPGRATKAAAKAKPAGKAKPQAKAARKATQTGKRARTPAPKPKAARTSAKAARKVPTRKATAATGERWVDPRTRDRELEPILDAALRTTDDAAFVELLRYGATLDVEDDDDRKLRPFRRGAPTTRGGLVRVHGPLKLDVDDIGYPLETIQPADGWPDALKAKFWLYVAEAHRHRYSDSLLNLTARALDNAIPWYETHDPIKAASMLGWCARVLGYASYGEDDMLPRVDRARALMLRAPAAPAAEYEITLQLCEAILRTRSGEHWPHTRELFELGVRGLELAAQLPSAPQRAELYHAVADALVRRPRDVELDVARVARLVAGDDPLSLAEAAWQRALELEDGMFYGVHRDDHVKSHKEAYLRGLAIIALRRGDATRALQLFDQGVEPVTIYERFNRTKTLLDLLRTNHVSREVRGQAIASRLRTDILDAGTLDDWDLEQATKYLDHAVYQLWNLGMREETSELVAAIRARQGFAEAQRATIERDESFRAELGSIADQHLGALFGTSSPEEQTEPTAEEVAAERAARLASETPAERVERIVDEIFEAWLRDTRTLLLFALARRMVDEASAQLEIEVNVPEYALRTLLEDRDIAAHVATLDDRLRTALPGTRIERTFKSVALDTGVPPDASLEMALGLAGAHTLMPALRLAPDPTLAQLSLDDPRVMRELAAQRARRRTLLWSF